MLGRFGQTDSRELLEQMRVVSIQASVVTLLTGLAVGGLMPAAYHDVALIFYWVTILLAGLPILRSAIRGLAEGHAHVDELVAIAITACLGANLVLDLPMIEEAAMVAVIMQLGALIEEWASSSAHRNIRSLEQLVPRTVRVVVGTDVVERDVDEVRPGDVLLVRPGDRVGADGRIIEGETTVDQAAITGESLPVERGIGDEIFAGSINNTGAVKIKVEHVRADSTLGRIIKMIRQGEAFQPAIVRTADKFFAYYTPAILLLATLVCWMAWGPTAEEKKDAVSRAVSVLVIGCPCPMLLAAPLAILCGLSRAARSGIAIKAGEFLEAVGQVSVAVFDKTGTLTTGKVRVVSVDPVAGGPSDSELLAMAASAEIRSNHPLALAILREAKTRLLKADEPTSFEQVGGLGVKALVGGRSVLVGSRKLIEKELGADAAAEQFKRMTISADDPTLHVYVFADGQAAGVIRMEDTVRDDAAAVVARLRSMGIERFVLLTGDRQSVAERVAASVGVREVHGDLMPQDKIDFIRRLQAQGLKVVMVGDGINDAPALVAADVGIAAGDTATEVALEASNAAILSGSLRPLPFFLGISRETNNTINRNLGIATGFNVIALAICAAGYVGVAEASGAHVAATVGILISSLALNKYVLPEPVGAAAAADAGTAPAPAPTPAAAR
jgi:Cd2+/Zn2+-exporting ATPase